MSDLIEVGDRVKWNRMSDDKPFEGIVLEIHEHRARVQPIDRPDDRMWPWLNRLTKLAQPSDLRQYASDGECAVDLGGTEAL